jgi:hypothetical protein
MRLIKRILDKAVLPFAFAAVLSGASSFWVINASAAQCTSGDGKATCSGECCNASATTCVAGPCAPAPAPAPAPKLQPRTDLADLAE